MKFTHPYFLFLLLILVPAGISDLVYYRKRTVSLFLHFFPEDAARSAEAAFGWSRFFFLLFMANTIIALADPYWGTILVSESRRGLDAVLAVDVSRSMNVRDSARNGEEVSRLERAVSLADGLVRNFSGTRFGLAVGRGKSALALPLTDDTEAILNYLAVISPDAVSGAGTNLEDLMDAAAGAFQQGFNTHRRIVLFSDGEGLEGSLLSAMDRLRDRDISLIAVGLGSAPGGSVPLAGGGFQRRNDGSPVISSLQADILREAAEISGGAYFDGNQDGEAARLDMEIKSLLDDSVSGGFKRVAHKRWRLFLAMGLFCLLMSRVIVRFARLKA